MHRDSSSHLPPLTLIHFTPTPFPDREKYFGQNFIISSLLETLPKPHIRQVVISRDHCSQAAKAGWGGVFEKVKRKERKGEQFIALFHYRNQATEIGPEFKRFFKKTGKVVWFINENQSYFDEGKAYKDALHSKSYWAKMRRFNNKSFFTFLNTSCDGMVYPNIKIFQELKDTLLKRHGHLGKVLSLPSRKVINGIDTLNRYRVYSPKERTRTRSLLGITSGQTVISFAGRLSPMKGADRLAEFIKASLKCQCNWVFLIATVPDTDYERFVTKLKADIGQENVRKWTLFLTDISKFSDSKAPPEKKVVHNFHDIPFYTINKPVQGISTVHILPSYDDTFPLSMIECLACGTPIIGTDIASLKVIVEKAPMVGRTIDNDKAVSGYVKDLITFTKELSLAPLDPGVIRNAVATKQFDQTTMSDELQGFLLSLFDTLKAKS